MLEDLFIGIVFLLSLTEVQLNAFPTLQSRRSLSSEELLEQVGQLSFRAPFPKMHPWLC